MCTLILHWLLFMCTLHLLREIQMKTHRKPHRNVCSCGKSKWPKNFTPLRRSHIDRKRHHSRLSFDQARWAALSFCKCNPIPECNYEALYRRDRAGQCFWSVALFVQATVLLFFLWANTSPSSGTLQNESYCQPSVRVILCLVVWQRKVCPNKFCEQLSFQQY